MSNKRVVYVRQSSASAEQIAKAVEMFADYASGYDPEAVQKKESASGMQTTYIDPATRTIADVCQLCAIDPAIRDPRIYLITRINVPHLHRGKGHGTKILQRMIDDADRENIILYVTPMSSGRWSNRTLRAWYERHGFAKLSEEYMIRQPVKPS